MQKTLAQPADRTPGDGDIRCGADAESTAGAKAEADPKGARCHAARPASMDADSLVRLNDRMERRYMEACAQSNFIEEHIPTLYEYARRCAHVTECGVETCISSWAFARGLRDNGRDGKRLVSIDVNYHPNIAPLKRSCAANGISFSFKRGSDLCVETEPTDLLFIDSWHVYGQLKRELARWHPHVAKWIVMHDTEVDAWAGETVRRCWDHRAQAEEHGFPVEEVTRGIWPAIEDFLEAHKDEWQLVRRWHNCNGLTVLGKVGIDPAEGPVFTDDRDAAKNSDGQRVDRPADPDCNSDCECECDRDSSWSSGSDAEGEDGGCVIEDGVCGDDGGGCMREAECVGGRMSLIPHDPPSARQGPLGRAEPYGGGVADS